MSWLRSRTQQPRQQYLPPPDAPPGWTPAAEASHAWGLYSDVPTDEFEAAEEFCRRHRIEAPKLLSSAMVERITTDGCKAWAMEQPTSRRFSGSVAAGGGEKGSGVTRVVTNKDCGDVCLTSNLPLLAGLYDVQGKTGVYYEVQIQKMDGIIAMGTACKPYPDWRFPGWNRGSAGLHLDDMRKFFEDPNGGMDYTPMLQRISPEDTIGCGYDFASCGIFFTYNGLRLPDAFGGVYVPRIQYDVYAAIGVEGACEFEINFGGDVFKWKEGNEWGWRVEGHVGRLSGQGSSRSIDELPTYEESRRR
ncbi:hypothetical protein PsYK624_018720 [Phanerochaete sordida]|uniref:B30.2/SPRY domain-containing protein n=1 Tax=Phanerochaete sordida TaxID=48140 RepID=A0A9P3G052_9APHY|nr:hypothetical protein PsYK624_018720 [Phanerochaete sordida]